MSEQELDNLIRDALLDAAELDEQARDSAAKFIPSDRYLRQMRAMCRSPNQWARRKTRPRWKTALQRVAVFFLAVSVNSGCVLAAVPQARAGVMQWVLEWYDHDMAYRFGGEPAGDVLPEYFIADLPDDFEEVVKDVSTTRIGILYENQEGELIDFEYGFMQQGTAAIFSTEGVEVVTVQVNHCDGQYLEAPPSTDSMNAIFWIDSEAGIYFEIQAHLDKNDILSLAESTLLVKTTK